MLREAGQEVGAKKQFIKEMGERVEGEKFIEGGHWKISGYWDIGNIYGVEIGIN